MTRHSARSLPVAATFEWLESRIFLDNNPPVVDDQIFNVNENSPNGTVVGAVAATDPDAGDTLTYAITGGNTGDVFAIDPDAGTLTVVGALDYETLAGYTLSVLVTDNGTPSLSTPATVTIGVNDVNDAPVIGNQSFAVDENSPVGTVVGTVVASDADAGQTLTYAIIGGNTGDDFAIDPDAGTITVVGALDYETLDTYVLTVQVTDSAPSPLSTDALVTISVNDVNEAPVISNQSFAVDENSPVGTVVGTVVATDADAGQTLTYAITDGNAGSAFAIDPATGQVTVAGALDYETLATYFLTVQVTDDGTPTPLSTAATVTLVINDVNDAPVVNDQGFGVQVGDPVGTVVGTVVATDADVGQTLTYAITAGNADNTFAIDPATGQITVAGALDPLGLDLYTFTVEVTDNGTPSPLSAAATVTIGFNEAPVISNQTFNVNENSPSGTVVGAVVATDPDVGDTLTYAITGGNTGDAFAIDPDAGTLTVVGALDYETKSSYALTVQVTDNGTPSLSTPATVTIGVNDVNDAPVINAQTIYVNEDTATWARFGTVVATDPDAGQTLSYAITAGNVGNMFYIDPFTGDLYLTGALNYETQTSYPLTVQVTDSAPSPLSTSALVTISVNDVNEAPVVGNQSFTVNENSPVGTVVGTVVATDPDAGQTLTYAITYGNTGNAFAIDPATGQITVAGALDHETLATCYLTLQVTDNGTPTPLSTPAIATIVINDVNEAPIINDQGFGVHVGDPVGTVVGTVVATDPDVGQTLTYAITVGNADNTFAIDPATGQITVAGELDPLGLALYTFTVEVTDNGTPSPLSAAATVTIGFNTAPVINNQTFHVNENSPNGTVVGTVVASDADVGQTLTYSITSGNTGDVFAIDPATGQITVAGALDYETMSSYALTVQVIDNGLPALHGTATVTVGINNVNEAPVINAQTFSVNENSAQWTYIGMVAATDYDAGQTLTYIITAGNGDSTFYLDSTGGYLYLQGTVDHETKDSYVLTVQVTDSGTPALSASAQVTVNINDVNEAPVINDQSFDLPEDSAVGATVGRALATDVDAGQTLTYSITAGNTGNVFAIDAATGWITVFGALDHTIKASYSLTVQVIDSGTTPLSGTATVTIAVNDIGARPVEVVALDHQEGGTSQSFGTSAALDGSYGLVGDPGEATAAGGPGAGAVRVYQHVGPAWNQTAYLTASDGAPGDAFGTAVALQGATAIVGAPGYDLSALAGYTYGAGSAYVFQRTLSRWVQTARLFASDATAGAGFGTSVSVSGAWAIVGAPGDQVAGTQGGSAYIYQKIGAQWKQVAKLSIPGAASGSAFGSSVYIDGNLAVVGAPSGGGGNGATYIYERKITGWTLVAEILAPAGAQMFGTSVMTDGGMVLVGAPKDAGAAYLFTRTGTTWGQAAKLTDPQATVDTHFGATVAFDGNLMVVGATNAVTKAGSVRVFRRQGATWLQLGQLAAPDAASDGMFGSAVAVSGNHALVGANADDTASAQNCGAAYVFEQKPIAGSFLTNGTVLRGDKIALSALNVLASNGAKVTSVQFFRDMNGNGVLDAGDLKLGAGALQRGTTNYILSVPSTGAAVKPPYALGDQHFLAQITDSNGGGVVVSAIATIANRPPTVASLTTNTKTYPQGGLVTLTAKGVKDFDGTVAKVEFYIDTDGSGTFDVTKDAKIGEQTVGKSGAYAMPSPYTLANDAPSGPLAFVAIATDDLSGQSAAAKVAPVVIPVVSIEVTDNEAAETVIGQDANLATFTIRRSSTVGALTVKLRASGKATFGPKADYTLSTDAGNLSTLSVVIPDGQSSVLVTLNVVDDIKVESAETAILSLVASPNYLLDAAPANRTATATILDNDATAKFTLTSPTFTSGQIPDKCCAYGGNISPALTWTAVPGSTKQLVLIVTDADAGGLIHWVVYKIPTTATGLTEGALPTGAVQGYNAAGYSGWLGPMSTSGRTHHYHFTLYALNAPLTIGAGLSKAVVMSAMAGHIIATTELVATYAS
jgi:Raf kinase inhibitor-like YbhB/YbcL family protein